MNSPQERIEYFPIELADWPGVVLIVARTADGKLYFPVRTMCGILGIAPNMQREKLRGDEDFAPFVRDDLPMPTVKGTRETFCIEWEGLGGWLSGIQSLRVRPEMRENMCRFRRLVWAAANEILLGQRTPTPMRPPLRARSHEEDMRELTSLVLQLESRLGAVEGTVFVPERDEDEMDAGEVAVTCPSCQARFRLQIAAAPP